MTENTTNKINDSSVNQISRIIEGFIIWQASKQRVDILGRFRKNTDVSDQSNREDSTNRYSKDRVKQNKCILDEMDLTNLPNGFFEVARKYGITDKEMINIAETVNCVLRAKDDILSSYTYKKELQRNLAVTEEAITKLDPDKDKLLITNNKEFIGDLKFRLEHFRKHENDLFDMKKSNIVIFAGRGETEINFNEDIYSSEAGRFKSFIKKHNNIAHEVVSPRRLFDLAISASEVVRKNSPKVIPGSKEHISDILSNSEPFRKLRTDFVMNFAEKVKEFAKIVPDTKTEELSKHSPFVHMPFIGKIRAGIGGIYLNKLLGIKDKQAQLPSNADEYRDKSR